MPRPGGTHLRLVSTAASMAAEPAPLQTSYRARSDEGRSLTFVGRAIEELCGVPARHFIRGRLTLLDLIHPDDRDRAVEGWSRDDGVLDYRIVHRGGGLRRVSDIRAAAHRDHASAVGTIRGEDRLDLADGADTTDPLTGLANRSVLGDRLALELARPHSDGTVAVLAVDVDGLGTYNRVHGRSAGDRLLRRVGGILTNGVRPMDLVSRCDDADFAVVLGGVSVDEALRRARTLARRVAEPGDATVSIGLATTQAGDDAAAILERAGRAGRAARRSGPGGLGIAPAQRGFSGPAA